MHERARHVRTMPGSLRRTRAFFAGFPVCVPTPRPPPCDSAGALAFPGLRDGEREEETVDGVTEDVGPKAANGRDSAPETKQ